MDNEARRDLTGTILGFYGDPRIEKPLSALHDDRELIAIVQPAMEILDKAEREAAIKKLVPRLAQESYHLNVGYVHIPWGVGPRVLTWQPWPLATYPSALHTVTLK
jgi:ABC-type transport system substrate-binding protein